MERDSGLGSTAAFISWQKVLENSQTYCLPPVELQILGQDDSQFYPLDSP